MSKTKFKNIYIVYLTIYSGKCLPKYYIGSTFKENLENGYRGSVCSKKYRSIWLEEQKDHPELFETIIIQEFKDRKNALEYELQLQKEHDVIKNPLFVNMAYASVNGFFGMIVYGEEHPSFGKTFKHSKKTCKKISKNTIGRKFTNEHRKNLSKNHADNSGKNNWRFKGYYHTPFGILKASRDIYKHTDKICHKTIQDWCKNSNRIIKKHSISCSKYLQSLDELPLGKTYRDVGFWFKHI